MARLDSLDLRAVNSNGLRTPADVAAVLAAVQNLGFVLAERLPRSYNEPGVGEVPAAVNVDDFVESKTGLAATQLRLPAQRGMPLRKGEMVSAWAVFALRKQSPKAAAHIQVLHLHPATWEVGIVLDPSRHNLVDRSVEDFCEEWSGLLVDIGDTVYARAHSPVQYLLTNGVGGLRQAAVRRQMIVGWRTWYGPEYAEAFGRDVLLGLPGTTRPLPDGGVVHQLEAPLVDMVRGRWAAYRPVVAYLEQKGIASFWPKVAAQSLKTSDIAMDEPSEDEDSVDEGERAMTDFRQGLRTLLDVRAVLPDRVVKPLLPDWTVLDDSLRPVRLRTLMLMLKASIETEMRDHPGKTVLFELGDDAPDDVRKIFDRLSQTQPKLSYVILPNKN